MAVQNRSEPKRHWCHKKSWASKNDALRAKRAWEIDANSIYRHIAPPVNSRWR